MPRANQTTAHRFCGGGVATAGVAFIARVEGARSDEDARAKLASVLGRNGAMALPTLDPKVTVRVYFDPAQAKLSEKPWDCRYPLEQSPAGETPRDRVLAKLAELRHVCDAAGLDFGAIDRAAYTLYLEQREERRSIPIETESDCAPAARQGV